MPGRFPNHLLSLVKPWLSGILSGEGDWQPGDRKTWAVVSDQIGFESQLCGLWTVWLWESYVTSSDFTFFVWNRSWERSLRGGAGGKWADAWSAVRGAWHTAQAPSRGWRGAEGACAPGPAGTAGCVSFLLLCSFSLLLWVMSRLWGHVRKTCKVFFSVEDLRIPHLDRWLELVSVVLWDLLEEKFPRILVKK